MRGTISSFTERIERAQLQDKDLFLVALLCPTLHEFLRCFVPLDPRVAITLFQPHKPPLSQSLKRVICVIAHGHCSVDQGSLDP